LSFGTVRVELLRKGGRAITWPLLAVIKVVRVTGTKVLNDDN